MGTAASIAPGTEDALPKEMYVRYQCVEFSQHDLCGQKPHSFERLPWDAHTHPIWYRYNKTAVTHDRINKAERLFLLLDQDEDGSLQKIEVKHYYKKIVAMKDQAVNAPECDLSREGWF